MSQELDDFIEAKTNSINTIGITDSISKDYLKEICEEYYLLKLSNRLPSYTKKGDYCSVCGSDEFSSDEEE